MSSPEISVIIPVYNTGKILQETIDSVLTQSFEDFELIIIDDGSTDPETAAVLDRQNDSRIKIIRQENAGVAAARNHGLSLAQGKYIAFLDHDDLFLPEKLAVSKELIESHPDAVTVFSEIIPTGDHLNRVIKLKECEKISYDKLLSGNQIYSMSCVMVKKSVPEQYGIRFDKVCVPVDDWDFHLQCALHGGIYRTAEPLVKYRFHSSNQSTYMNRMYEAGIRVMRKYEKMLPEISAKSGFSRRMLQKSIDIAYAGHYYGLAFWFMQHREYGSGLRSAVRAFFHNPFFCTAKVTSFVQKKLKRLF